jgi:hypothetical protein
VLKVYDSSYDNLDGIPAANFERLFNMPLTYKIAEAQKQKGCVDCGVFAIANTTDIALSTTETPHIHFDQDHIRAHLVHCLEKKSFSPFPAYN